MSQELLYTSAPRGLKPGSRGFSTVASTSGMAPNLADQLESLSGYRHVFPPQDPRASQNPVVWSHLRLTVGGRALHVLSRIADAGLDYTQRTNKFAHHVVLDASELVPAGPAWLLAAPGFMETKWAGEPRLLPAGRRPPMGSSPAAVCRAWQDVAGDAGWGGALAETALPGSQRQAVVVYRPGTNVLPLVVEALALLPPEVRWQVTFSTYYTKLPAGMDCKWRFVVEGTPEAAAARQPQSLLINLCAPLAQASGGPLVEAARTGVVPDLTQVAPSARQSAALPAGGAPDDELLRALLDERAGTGPAKRRAGQASTPPPLSVPTAPPELFESLQPVTDSLSPRDRAPRWRQALAMAAAVLVGVGIGAGGVLWFQPPELTVASVPSTHSKPADQPSTPAASPHQNEKRTQTKPPPETPNVSLESQPAEAKSDKVTKQTSSPSEGATPPENSAKPPAQPAPTGSADPKLPSAATQTPMKKDAAPPPEVSWKAIPDNVTLPEYNKNASPTQVTNRHELFPIAPVPSLALKVVGVGLGGSGAKREFRVTKQGGGLTWDVELSTTADDSRPGAKDRVEQFGQFAVKNEKFTFEWKVPSDPELLRRSFIEISDEGTQSSKLVALRNPIVVSAIQTSLADTSTTLHLKDLSVPQDAKVRISTPVWSLMGNYPYVKFTCTEGDPRLVSFENGDSKLDFNLKPQFKEGKLSINFEYVGAVVPWLNCYDEKPPVISPPPWHKKASSLVTSQRLSKLSETLNGKKNSLPALSPMATPEEQRERSRIESLLTSDMNSIPKELPSLCEWLEGRDSMLDFNVEMKVGERWMTIAVSKGTKP